MASTLGQIEFVLLQTKTFQESRYEVLNEVISRHQSQQTSFTHIQQVQRKSQPRSFGIITKLIHGVVFLKTAKSNHGWQQINLACEGMCQIIDQQPIDIIQTIFNVFFYSERLVFPTELKKQLGRFVTKILAHKLGCKHPLSLIAYYIQGEEILEGAIVPALEFLLVSLEGTLGRDNKETWQLKMDLIENQLTRKDYAAAEASTLSFLRQSENTRGRTGWITRRFLAMLGEIYTATKQYELAVKVYEDVQQRVCEALGDKFPDHLSMAVFVELAWLYGKLEKFIKSEGSCREAVAGILNSRSPNDPEYPFWINEVKILLRCQQLDPETWFRQHFGISNI